jgi:hypothetical protein
MDIGSIISDGLNLRAEPNITGTIVDKLSPEDKLEVYSRVSGGWLKVRVLRTGQLGYVSERFVELETPETSPPLRPAGRSRRGGANAEEKEVRPFGLLAALRHYARSPLIGGGLVLFAAIVVVVLLVWR